MHQLEQRQKEIKELVSANAKIKSQMQQNLNEKIVAESKAGIRKARNSTYVVPRHFDYLQLIFEELMFNP